MLSQAMSPLIEAISKLRDAEDDRGQTLVEYALLLFFIAIVVIAALMLLGPTVSAIFQSVNDQI
jgi:pilus assembly protein Flp/PilA